MTPASEIGILIHPSPIGEIVIVAQAGELLSVEPVVGDAPGTVPVHLRDRITPLASAAPAAQTAAAQLEDYFAGRRTRFDLPLRWSGVPGFAREALRAVCDIPYGETASYGEVAVLAGRPRAARAVGTACARTPFSVVVPVHRVIRADGSLGEYGGQPEIKRYLLDHESRFGHHSVRPEG
ncbi:methylated-DNA--[protein]-cysteine S-methyltransferase [Microbacterium sediminicola]|uniref:Methylated-DNA--[protein]-cysteine S-methyltransferase n=1 Tax=Microbacterium sediminicola TaxID=415210 RepID=A0ABN2I3S0_9MICO